MKKDIAIRWVEALRSGKYNQDQHRLKTDDGYCCLGVLCEITQDHHAWRFEENALVFKFEENAYQFEGVQEKEILPDSLRVTFEISSNEQDDFTVMNDDSGMSFKEIADYIQAKYIDETFDGGRVEWEEKMDILREGAKVMESAT